MTPLLKEILSEIKCMHKDITELQKQVGYIKEEMNIAKKNLEVVSDHSVKFDSHIDFIENKFNWYKGTLDFIQSIVTLKFLGGVENNPISKLLTEH